ncbi:cytochrome oxidase assembly protein-domain-containing protein [Lipomyces oligophaga]|uniref:cytochrome oxidase assembly protein-domain-containing protein n=1 Tax=Lipomyces oligophaga TaxID=45792 RepID=UPI0034CE79A9
MQRLCEHLPKIARYAVSATTAKTWTIECSVRQKSALSTSAIIRPSAQRILPNRLIANGLVGRNWKAQLAERAFSCYSMVSQSTDFPASSTISIESTAKRSKIMTSRSVGLWMVGSAALVFGIVVIGGLTRLTESGLSITEWKPVTGMIPPITQSEWEEEFEKYKKSPEYKLLNSQMTVDEFKFIFFMEWSHRLWGRMIGLTFVIPGAYFILRGRTSPRVTRRIFGIACLIGFQGFIGWWMVKSGLSDHFLEDGVEGKHNDNHPRVSQYRLATHLGLAFMVYLAMLWTGLEVLRENKWAKNPPGALQTFSQLSNPTLKRYKLFATGLLALVFTTAMSGAFVAGLDAGLIYNEFPYMGETIIPPTKEIFSTFYSRAKDDADLIWRNMLENPVTVQLEHRILATTSFFSILAFHFFYSVPLYKSGLLPRTVFRASHGVIGFAFLQVTLGITTLLYLVPIPLAAAHQMGSLALLTEVLVLCGRLRVPRASVVEILKRSNKAAAAPSLSSTTAKTTKVLEP